MARGGRREGAGRPKGTSGKTPTRVVRVPVTVTDDQLRALESVVVLLDHWEEECTKNPDGARYHFLRQAIEDVRATGF